MSDGLLVQTDTIPRTVKIGDRFVGDGKPCWVVMEIGINHNGDIDICKKLIDIAVENGADAIKLQKRTVDVVYTAEELAALRENPFGPTNGDLKHGLEFGQEAYEEIDQYCKKRGIAWFASCWDEGSVDFIDQFDPPCYKIASASLTDANLLRHTCSKGKPLLISTGMSKPEEVRNAVKLVREQIGDKFILLHTISTYPSENADLNLKAIISLRNDFLVPIGYSGHERGVSPSIMATTLGSCVIERHFTLDRTMWGSDQAASLEPKGLSILIRDIRTWEIACGDGQKALHPKEVPIMKKLRRKNTL